MPFQIIGHWNLSLRLYDLILTRYLKILDFQFLSQQKTIHFSIRVVMPPKKTGHFQTRL